MAIRIGDMASANAVGDVAPYVAASPLAVPAGLARWLTKEERERLAKPEAARLALERAIGDTDATPHVTAWLKTIATPNTRRGYAIDCLAFIDWVRDRTKVAEAPIDLGGVSDLIVAEYVEHIRETPSPATGKPLSVASQARRLAALSVMFRYLKRKGHVKANPLLDLERPGVSREGMTPALSMDDVDKLLRAARKSPYDPDRDLALVAVLSVQALRVSEILRADVGDLSTERGRRMLRVTMKRTKQVKIQIDAAVVPLLDAHIGDRTAGPLLLNNHGGRLDMDQAKRILARLSNAAGIATVTPHMLRTTAITELLERGMPQHQVQHMVRHSSGDTTGRYWRRRAGVEQDAALTAQLAARLSGGLAPYDRAGHQKHMDRLADASAGRADEDGGHAIFEAEMAASLDMAVAQMIRNDRSGSGKGLRASGFTETADLLGL